MTSGPDAAPAAEQKDERPSVRGRLGLVGDRVVATIAEYRTTPGESLMHVRGIAAYDRTTLSVLWQRRDVPGLALVDDGTIYAYGRSGSIVAIDDRGHQIWRRDLPDDRSEAARRRGDLGAPFQADVVRWGDALHVAAGGEVIELSRENGVVLRRARVCEPARAVVGRLAASSDSLFATCMLRSARDDETAPADWLGEGSPPVWNRRLQGGALVGLSRTLEPRFRLDLAALDLFPADRLPVVLSDGRVGLAAGKLRRSDGIESVEGGATILFIDARTGAVLSRQENDGGFSDAIACLDGRGFFAGAVLYDAASGAVVRRFELADADLELVDPVARDGAVLLAGARDLWALDLQTGIRSKVGDYGAAERAQVTTPLIVTSTAVYLGIDAGGGASVTTVRLR